MTRLQAFTFALAVAALSLPAGAQPSAEALRDAASSTFAAPRPAFPLRGAATLGTPQDELLDLLEDRDPAVRAEAAKALKEHVLYDSRVERKLVDLAREGREEARVRREAIKSLAWAAQHWSTMDVLIALAKDRREAEDLRAIAFKSLYVVAGRERRATDALLDGLDASEPALVRKGAVWALGGAAADYGASRRLLELAQDGGETAEFRAEGVKTLFHQLAARNDIQWAVRSLAEDRAQPVAVREAAVLSLVLLNQDYSVQRLLQDISRNAPEPRLRAAAIKAMGGLTLELTRYFHLSHFRGKFIDPLVDE